ncbi:hypothetical protein Syun_027916 [Stephania yunnanensis]|uniref:Uncharacterized protein n=1 Tax=Stephania yunnanensis TaxID=152371 RepID=A0AAP0EIW2_9MAGN
MKSKGLDRFVAGQGEEEVRRRKPAPSRTARRRHVREGEEQLQRRNPNSSPPQRRNPGRLLHQGSRFIDAGEVQARRRGFVQAQQGKRRSRSGGYEKCVNWGEDVLFMCIDSVGFTNLTLLNLCNWVMTGSNGEKENGKLSDFL